MWRSLHRASGAPLAAARLARSTRPVASSCCAVAAWPAAARAALHSSALHGAATAGDKSAAASSTAAASTAAAQSSVRSNDANVKSNSSSSPPSPVSDSSIAAASAASATPLPPPSPHTMSKSFLDEHGVLHRPSGGIDVEGLVPWNTRVAASTSEPERVDESLPGGPKSHLQTVTISIDRSGLLGVHHVPDEVLEDQSHKSRKTPLVDELRSQIKIRGALTVADWMFQCLQNQQHGYYTARKARRVIGGKSKAAREAEEAAAAAEAAEAAMDSTKTASEIEQARATAAAPDAAENTSATEAAEQENAVEADEEDEEGGDFITSPELGQIFGEMLGVWVLQVWEKLGKPSEFQLVELGPGRGTLLRDVLRATSRFPQFMHGVRVHLCETSPTMREEQIATLGVQGVQKQMDRDEDRSSPIHFSTKGREHTPIAPVAGMVSADRLAEAFEQAVQEAEKHAAKVAAAAAAAAKGARPASASSASSASPSSAASSSSSSSASPAEPLLTPQEKQGVIESLLESGALDSPDILMHGRIKLPILRPGEKEPPPDHRATWPPVAGESGHAQSSTKLPASVPIHWHSKVSQIPLLTKTDGTPAPIILLAHEFFDALPVYQFVLTERGWCEKLVDSDQGRGPHHFRFMLSAQPTLASRTFLPVEQFPTKDAKIGDAVEISGAGLACMEELSRRLSASGGAALVIDYGTNHPNANTLQAVQKHEFRHALEQPGEVDLTALVDFKSLRATVERTNKLHPSRPLTVLPLITQSHLLRNLNIAARLESMVEKASSDPNLTEEDVCVLIDNATRLVDPNTEQGGMGSHFKAMCIVSQELAKEEIVPFNFEDPLQKQEDEAYARAVREARVGGGAGTVSSSLSSTASKSSLMTGSTGGGGLLDPHTPLSSSITAASGASPARQIGHEHRYSSCEPPPEAAKPKSPAASSSATNRRAAAREAAEQLARARAEKERAAQADRDAQTAGNKR